MDGLILGYLLLGFSSAAGAFVITTGIGESYVDLATYGITAVNRTSLLFKVKGCDNAHIGIYQSSGVRQNMVEFVIGARKNSGYDIREYINGAYPVYQVSEKRVLLDCYQFRTFWISWDLTPAGHRSWLLGQGHEVFSDVIGNFTNIQPDNGAWVSIGISPYVFSSLQWEFDIEKNTATESLLIPTDSTEIATGNATLTTVTDVITTVAQTTANATQTTVTGGLATANATLTRLGNSQFTTDTLRGGVNETSCRTGPCWCKSAVNFSEEDLIEFNKNISRILKVNKKQTSAYRRSLISVREERTSARVIGNVGVIFIVAVVGGICALDISRFLRASKYIISKDTMSSKKPSAA